MKYLPLYFVTLFCLLFTTCHNGQLYTLILDEAAHLSDSIPSQALLKLEEIKNVKRLSGAEQARYNLIFIKAMLRSGNKLSSDSIIHATTRYYQNHNDSSGLHQVLYYNGLYHYRNAIHDSAILYFDKAVQAVPVGNDKDQKAGYKRTAGYSYLYLGDTEAAIKIQKEGLEYARISNDSLSVIYSLLSLAEAYKYNKETELSLEYYAQTHDLIREREDRDMEASILNIISRVYESDNRIEEALHYKNLSQEIKRNRQDVPATNLYRAILFDKQNRTDSARYYAELSIKGDDPYVADLAYSFLRKSEAKQGHFNDALNLSKNSEQVFNTFLSNIHSTDMQQKYEKVKLENENNQLKIKQEKHRFYLLTSTFLLLLMLIVFYIIRANNIRKIEKAVYKSKMLDLQQKNLLLKQQKEISTLREKEAVLRESLLRKIQFFKKLPSLNREDNDNHDRQGKIKITSNDWQEFINVIRDAYPDFSVKLKQQAPSLTDDEVLFCCLLKIEVNMQDLSDIYCVSKAAITKRKYRLKTEKFLLSDNSLNLDAIVRQIN